MIRYEHEAPGDVLHISIKKFARIAKAGHRISADPCDKTHGAGWEFLYVAVDFAWPYTALYLDEKAASSAGLLQKATARLRLQF